MHHFQLSWIVNQNNPHTCRIMAHQLFQFFLHLRCQIAGLFNDQILARNFFSAGKHTPFVQPGACNLGYRILNSGLSLNLL